MVGSPIKTTFIVGCGRSGTTVLFKTLGEHPDFARTFGFPDGEDHEGWANFGQAPIAGLCDPELNDGLSCGQVCQGLSGKDVSDEIRHQMRRYYMEDVLQNQLEKVVLNKNPHLSGKLTYVKSIFPEAKFVHVIRDAPHMIASWMKIMEMYTKLSVAMPDGEGDCLSFFPIENQKPLSKAEKIDIFVKYWDKTNEFLFTLRQKYMDDFLLIKYENFCKDPMLNFRAICRFSGVSDDVSYAERAEIQLRDIHPEILDASEISYIEEKTNSVRKLFRYV